MRHRLGTRIVLLTALVAVITACATSPTGRRQLQLFPAEQIASMGDSSYQQLREKEQVLADGPRRDFVSCVSHALTAGMDGDWEVTVFEKDQVNAFALPGNNIGVFTELLDVTDNQSQLATVLGHEIAHVKADHGNERMSTQFAAQAGLQLASAVTDGSATGQMVMAALGLGTQVGVLLPFSRAQETEADILGLQRMAEAGFDPRESVELWRNMAKEGGSKPPELLSTHPATETRIRNMNERMDEAVQTYERAREAGQRPNCPKP